jgi:hypothetical protein
VDDGYYKIIAQHSGKALDVFGGVISQRNGVVVQQRDYNGGDNQKWQITCAGDGFYKIVAKHSGKALDIDYNGEPGALGNGPFAQQWDDWGGDNQKFWFQPLSPGLPYGRPTPATCPSEADARLRVNLYTADSRIYRRTRQFRLDQPIVLKVENNTGAPIYLKQGNRPERLIREEGLQVERLDGSNWFPVLPSGQCEPSYVETHNGDGTVTRTHIDAAPVTQLIELRATMNITRLWTAPAALGPGIYRLSLTYSRSDARSSPPSFICSSTFEVASR